MNSAVMSALSLSIEFSEYFMPLCIRDRPSFLACVRYLRGLLTPLAIWLVKFEHFGGFLEEIILGKVLYTILRC